MRRPDWIDEQLYPFSDHWLEADGHTIHYVDEGPRDAPVFLFLHPGPGWSFTWRHHIQAFSDRFRCIAPDFPGYGLSTPADGYGYTLREQARALEGFLEHLDLHDITLWANDGGGPTGMIVAGRHPARFRAFVVGGTFGWSLKRYPKVAGFIRFVSGRTFRTFNRWTGFLAKTQYRLAFGTRDLTKAEAHHYRMPFAEPLSRDRPLILFGSFAKDGETTREMEQGLDRLSDRPCLILFGDRDPMYGEGWHRRWAEEFPDHEMHILPKVKHFPFEDAPEETVRIFERWNASR